MIRISILFILTILIFSCGKNKVSINEYVAFLENPENGLIREKSIEGFTFILQYKTPEYIAAVSANTKNLNNNIFRKQVGEFSDLYHFTIKIKADGPGEFLRAGNVSQEEYFNRINYFTLHASDDIKLIIGNDTIPCEMYHFERSYNSSPYAYMVLGFEKSKIRQMNEDLMLTFDEKVLGLGQINFTITSESINKIPQIQLDENQNI